ncbi:MAG: anti-sigma-D factor RsdA [Pseudonocardiaceae bacterium]
MSERDDETHRGYSTSDAHSGQDGRPGDDLTHDALVSPSDLAAVQADDALLDLLGRADAATPLPDDPLARVLMAWRREVDAEPVGELVDTDTALEVVAAARRPARRRRPMLAPFAAAAALFVIAFSGVGVAAKSAQPGDPLWGVTQVLYSEHARSVEAAHSVRTELEQASQQLERGRPDAAQGALQRAENKLPAVVEAEEQAKLQDRLQAAHDELQRRQGGGPGSSDESSATASGSSTKPSRPAKPPVVDATSPSSSTPSTPPTAPSTPTPVQPPPAGGEQGPASSSGGSSNPPAGTNAEPASASPR